MTVEHCRLQILPETYLSGYVCSRLYIECREVETGHTPEETQYMSVTALKNGRWQKLFAICWWENQWSIKLNDCPDKKYETRLFAKMCGCMVLKAEEKSANKILAWVWGPSRCLYKVFKMNNSVMASSSLVKLTNVNSVVYVVYSWVGDVIHTFFTAGCYTLPLIVFSAIYSQMNYFFYST